MLNRLPSGQRTVPFAEFLASTARNGDAGHLSYEAPNTAVWATRPADVARQWSAPGATPLVRERGTSNDGGDPMRTRRWLSPVPLILVTLSYAWGFAIPAPAVAATLLIAEPSGSVGAGDFTATPVTVTTPGAGSMAVSWVAAAEDAAAGASASAEGGGVATYGALAGLAQAEAVRAPGPHAAGATLLLDIAFRDTAEVVSPTLAPGPRSPSGSS